MLNSSHLLFARNECKRIRTASCVESVGANEWTRAGNATAANPNNIFSLPIAPTTIDHENDRQRRGIVLRSRTELETQNSLSLSHDT